MAIDEEGKVFDVMNVTANLFLILEKSHIHQVLLADELQTFVGRNQNNNWVTLIIKK